MIDQPLQLADVRRIAELTVADLPSNCRLRLQLDLAEDALGRMQRLPLIVIRGRRDGPVLGITCALHGNEVNGIPVIHRLAELLDPGALRGTVVMAPVVNIPGFIDCTRPYRDGQDLNHLMPGKSDGNESQVFAYRLFQRLVLKFNYLVDLHTASFGRVNSLYVRADLSDPVTAAMARLQNPQIILHNPPSDSTLRGAAAERGIPAITVEIGDPQIFQPRHVRPTLAGVRAVLAHLGMIPKRKLATGTVPIVCVESGWIYTERGGLLTVLPEVAELVSAGDVVATQRNIFGDIVAEYRAPYDGVVIGKSCNPVSPTGARIMHLGRLAQDYDQVTPEDSPPAETVVTADEGDPA